MLVLLWCGAGTCLLSSTAAGLGTFLVPQGRGPCAPGLPGSCPVTWESSAEQVVQGQFLALWHSLCSLSFSPLSWPVPHPVFLEERKAACDCAGVCRSADAPGKELGYLIPEEDTWQCAREAQPERKPRVLLQELVQL